MGVASMSLRHFRYFATAAVAAVITGCYSTMTYSPLTGSPCRGRGGDVPGCLVGALKTEPYHNSSLLVKAPQPAGEIDNQWITLGLSVPGSAAGRRITGVEVCYEINAPPPDTAYIAQTRLTDMTTPKVATVILDDATRRTAGGPTCYKTIGTGTIAQFTAKGTVNLELRVVLSNTRDELYLGMVRLYF